MLKCNKNGVKYLPTAHSITNYAGRLRHEHLMNCAISSIADKISSFLPEPMPAVLSISVAFN